MQLIDTKKGYFIFYKVIIFNFLILTSCANNRLYNLENEINNFIARQSSNFELRLDTISSFEWDELLVAGPYTDLDKIKEYELSTFSNEIKHHDKFTFFGFLNKKKGVKWVELNGAKVFDSIASRQNNGYGLYTKSKCIFKLKK